VRAKKAVENQGRMEIEGSRRRPPLGGIRLLDVLAVFTRSEKETLRGRRAGFPHIALEGVRFLRVKTGQERFDFENLFWQLMKRAVGLG